MEVMESEKQRIRLTKYNHGASCGYKIAPDFLEDILNT